MQKLEYLKNFQSALKTYTEENQIIDIEKMRQIYEYATNLDNLTPLEKQQLDDFINDNTISITHLANIYLDENGISHLNYQLKRMMPMQVTKPQCKMRFLKGNETTLSEAINPVNRVKVLCKTKNQTKAA